jgi:hypothetical protein
MTPRLMVGSMRDFVSLNGSDGTLPSDYAAALPVFAQDLARWLHGAGLAGTLAAASPFFWFPPGWIFWMLALGRGGRRRPPAARRRA